MSVPELDNLKWELSIKNEQYEKLIHKIRNLQKLGVKSQDFNLEIKSIEKEYFEA